MKGAATIRRELKAYADRGVFRSFAEDPSKEKGKIIYEFLYIGTKTATLVYTGEDETLILKDLLREVSPEMFKRLKSFLTELFDPELPDHRRIDPRWADVKLVKRGGSVSVVFRVKGSKYKYAVNKLINLTSWIHTYLQSWFPDYLTEVLGEPQE